MLKVLATVVALALAANAHGDHKHDQEPIAGALEKLWYSSRIPGDGGTQV